MTPLYSRVLIEPIEEKETKSGIILHKKEDSQETLTGKVLAVGKGRRDDKTGEWIPPHVQVGNIVVFKRFSGDKVEEDGKKLLIVDEGYILGVLD